MSQVFVSGSHTLGAPAVQTPPLQTSDVHLLLSRSQGFVLSTRRQTPNVGSQISVVHTFPSLQLLSVVHSLATMQSDGSEPGCSDGYEQTSIILPPSSP